MVLRFLKFLEFIAEAVTIGIQEKVEHLRPQIVKELGESDPVCAAFLGEAKWAATDFCLELQVASNFALGSLTDTVKQELIKEKIRHHFPGLTVNIIYDPTLMRSEVCPSEAEEGGAFRSWPSPTAGFLPIFTFEQFVVSDSNHLACALAMEVAQGTGPRAVLLYGSTGCGKTHLLKAAARHSSERFGIKARYVTGEGLLNDYVVSSHGGNLAMHAFRERYRRSDLLVLDDVHFLARGKKEDTVQELLSTWREREERGAPMLLGSTEPVDDLKFPPELRSRLLGACRAEIRQPEKELRVSIVLKIAERLGMKFERSWAQAIVERSGQNAREPGSELMRLHMHVSRLGRTLDNELIVELFAANPDNVTFDRIVSAVVQHYGILEKDLRSKNKSRRVADPRQMVMFLAYEMMKGASFSEIGQALGRDPTTVMYAHRKMLARAASHTEIKFKRDVDAIKVAVTKRA